MGVILENAEYYRSLARTAVDRAQRTRDPHTKAALLQLAISWHELADGVEALAQGKRSKIYWS
jgi:hypothetical protein